MGFFKKKSPEPGSFTALLGESVYTASRALLLPDLASELMGKRVRDEFGWLMSVPNRHQVVWHIIDDATVVAAVNGRARFTAMGYSDSPRRRRPRRPPAPAQLIDQGTPVAQRAAGSGGRASW